jgi:putative tricarboxylic transport membrane protein
MKCYERIAAGLHLAIGAAAAWMAIEMGYGSAHSPGPGFLPFWIAILLALTAGIYLLECLGPDAVPQPLWERGVWRGPALAAVIMLLFTLLMGWLGFFASTCLLFLAWLVLVERERWWVVAATAVLGTACAYVLFSVLLRVPLPQGLLF